VEVGGEEAEEEADDAGADGEVEPSEVVVRLVTIGVMWGDHGMKREDGRYQIGPKSCTRARKGLRRVFRVFRTRFFGRDGIDGRLAAPLMGCPFGAVWMSMKPAVVAVSGRWTTASASASGGHPLLLKILLRGGVWPGVKPKNS